MFDTLFAAFLALLMLESAHAQAGTPERASSSAQFSEPAQAMPSTAPSQAGTPMPSSAPAQSSAPNGMVATFDSLTSTFAYVGYPWLPANFRL